MANEKKSHHSRKDAGAEASTGLIPLPSSKDSALAKAIAGGATPGDIATIAFDAAERDAAIQDAVAEFQQPKELPRHKQSWYRSDDSKARKTADKIIVMRTAGRSDAEIAKKLHMAEATIRQYVWLAKKNGWLDDEGEIINVEAELAHSIDAKVVRNISASLDGQMTNWQTHEMTIAAAKGRGMFKNHEKNEGAVVMAPVAIQIVMPALSEGQQRVAIPEEMVGGTPAFVDGEVVNGTDGARRLESGQAGDGAQEAAAPPLQRQPA